MPTNSDPINVVTNRNGNTRVGAYLNEVHLNPDNVNVRTFGKLFSRTVDGDLYAQPLIVSGLNLAKARNVVFLATSRNWVYAYNADDHTECLPLWQVNLGRPVPREDIYKPHAGLYMNFANEVGITSTPVIALREKGKGVMYVVAKSRVDGIDAAQKEGFEYRIHALDIRTGKPFNFDRKKRGRSAQNSSVKISAKAHDPESGRTVEFDAKWHLNRPGLLLLDGVLYLAFGSHGDEGEFWGWIMAYDAHTLAQLAVHCTAPDWGEGGVWQSGCGLAGESVPMPNGGKANFVYAVVGNGQKPIPEPDNGGASPLHTIPDAITAPFYGNSILKLTLVRRSEPTMAGRPPEQGDPDTPFRFDVVDWFTTSDCLDLNEWDEDLIGGPVLFSARGRDGGLVDLVLGGGKDGKFYLADRNRMGKWQPMSGREPYQLIWWDPDGTQHSQTINLPYQVSENDVATKKHWVRSQQGRPHNNIIQDDKICEYHIHGAPVLWQKSDAEVTAYVWSEKDFCKAITFRNGRFDLVQSTSLYGFPPRELRMPGGILALSADGKKDGTGIVWASHPTDDDGMNKTVRGTLRAFDARDLNVELWNSDKNPDGEDRLGNFAKFCPPVIANGKVYMATFSRELVVYGLLEDIGKNRSSEECDIWTLTGIGGGVQGSCEFSCARYTVHTTGQGLATPEQPAGTADSFYFPHLVIDSLQQPEITIAARVVGIRSLEPDSKNPDARVGIMVRAFDDNAGNLPTVPYAAMVFSPVSGALFQRRLKDKIASVQDGPMDVFAPNWLRLSCEATERSGFLRFKGEISSDGVNWRQVGALSEIEISGRVMVGLVATVQTKSSSAQVEARFSDVVVTPWTG